MSLKCQSENLDFKATILYFQIMERNENKKLNTVIIDVR